MELFNLVKQNYEGITSIVVLEVHRTVLQSEPTSLWHLILSFHLFQFDFLTPTSRPLREGDMDRREIRVESKQDDTWTLLLIVSEYERPFLHTLHSHSVSNQLSFTVVKDLLFWCKFLTKGPKKGGFKFTCHSVKRWSYYVNTQHKNSEV